MNSFNKEIVNILIDEFYIALSHSTKDTNEFFAELVLQNPEIVSSTDEWHNFSQEIKDNVIRRIKNTLLALKRS